MKKTVQVFLIALGIIILVFLLNPPYRMVGTEARTAYLYNVYTGRVVWFVRSGTLYPVDEIEDQPDVSEGTLLQRMQSDQ